MILTVLLYSAPSPAWNCQWGPYSLYPRYVRASMLPKKESKISTHAMHFKWHHRVWLSRLLQPPWIIGTELPFGLFQFFNTKKMPQNTKIFIRQPRWNMIGPVIFAGALTIFAGALPPWAPPWWRGWLYLVRRMQFEDNYRCIRAAVCATEWPLLNVRNLPDSPWR